MDDHDLRDADGALSSVKDLIKKPDYRDIRGIDKRLAMLDAKLRLLEGDSSCHRDPCKELLVAFRHARTDEGQRESHHTASGRRYEPSGH